jgi:hypothetical protein
MRCPAGLNTDHGPRLRRKEIDQLRPPELTPQDRLFGSIDALEDLL